MSNNTRRPARPAVSGGDAWRSDGTREKLAAGSWGSGLTHAAEALAEELSEAVKHDRAAHVVLDRLLSARGERPR